jgi:hypothetical protein
MWAWFTGGAWILFAVYGSTPESREGHLPGHKSR